MEQKQCPTSVLLTDRTSKFQVCFHLPRGLAQRPTSPELGNMEVTEELTRLV